MNREKVIELARAAGFQTGSINQADGSFGYHWVSPIGNGCLVELESFAALVSAAEREECAKVCEEISDNYMQSESLLYPEMKTDAQTGASDCEAAIRARNTHKEQANGK